MTYRPAVTSPSWWIGAVVLAAVVVGAVAIVGINRSGDRGSGLSDRFDYDLRAYEEIDPALILYDLAAEIDTEVGQPRAVAVGPGDRIYVAGDEGIQVFSPDGAPQSKIALPGTPQCLAVGGAGHVEPGRIYAGIGNRVERFDPGGRRLSGWEVPGDRPPRLTSIALAERDIFVADAAGCVVLRFDTSGKLLGRIGEASRSGGTPGLAIPSPFFDVAIAPDGRLWVVNPAALRLQAYDFDGHFEMYWGKASASVDGFFGCCNPANIAILPDGRFVTAEKGLVRVKIYSPFGDFVGVVAGPKQMDWLGRATGQGRFDHEYKAVDVAADSHGRVVVLDLAGPKLRIYEPKTATAREATDEPSD